MSDLILPKNYQNPVLDANLQAFFKRYPYERTRLEPLLSKPVGKRADINIDVPPCPSKPPIRVLLLAGIGSPAFLMKLLNDPIILVENFQVFIMENDPDFLAWLFQNWDLRQVLTAEKIEWVLMHNAESVKAAMFRVLKREHVAALMKSVHILETTARVQEAGISVSEEIKTFYKSLPQAYDETVFHVLHNFGRIDDSLDGIKATLMNKEVLLNKPGIEDLKGAFKGMPALVVGAGPSLDKELETIKKNNDKFVVIAADAALKPLLKAGIRVDYCTSIERLNDYQKPFFDGLDRIETELVAFPVVLPSQFALYPGPIRLVYRNYSFFAYFEKAWPKAILKCGGSTTHLALRLADWMGCSKIILLGIDSCYETGSDGLYRSHCSNTGHEEWSKFVPLEAFQKERNHLPPIVGINNLGEEVMTNLTYYQWAKEYVEELAEIGHRIPIINCSSTGLKIAGIQFKPLVEVVERQDEVGVKKPVPPKAVYNRTFDHKVIVKNFKEWLKLSESAVKECDVLLGQESVDLARYDALNFIFNFRFAVDSLFVSFIIQCCAKEFFDLENGFWALDRRPDVDVKEKLAIFKSRFTLFGEVLTKLINIFEEMRDEQIH